MKRSHGAIDLTALDNNEAKDCGGSSSDEDDYFFHPLKCVKYAVNSEEDDSISYDSSSEDSNVFVHSLTIHVNPIDLMLKVPNESRRIVYARSPKKDFLKKEDACAYSQIHDNYLIGSSFKDKCEEKPEEIVCYLENLRLCHKRSE